MRNQKFKVVAQDPTNNNEKFSRTFYHPTLEGAEVEADLSFGAKNVLSVEPDLTPCRFDLWLDNKLSPQSAFYTNLYNCFAVADEANREKLAIGFPEEFI